MKRPMCVIAACLCLGIFLLLRIRPPSVVEDDGTFPKEALMKGTVSDKYLKNGSFFLVLSNARSVREKNTSEKSINVIVKLKSDPEEGEESGTARFLKEPEAGQQCLVYGKVYIFERSRNPGQFDMALYERYRGIDLELTSSEIKKVWGRGSFVKEHLLRLKHRLSSVFETLMDEEDAGVLKAMVLGDKNSLSPEIKGLYERAGISHVLCISGLHISLLGCGMYLFLQGRLIPGRQAERFYLARAPAGALSMTFLILYGIMTGMGVSIKRAIVMFILLTVAEIFGRTYDMLSALAFSSVVLLLSDPYILYDAGFVLSFTAVLSIGLFKPAVDVLFPTPDAAFGKLIETLKLSLCINIFSFPVVLRFFYRIPLYSVFLNLILIPLMAVVLVLAVLACVLGIFSPVAASIPAFFCRLILGFYKEVCIINDRLHKSVIVKGAPDDAQIVVYYLILGAVVAGVHLIKTGRSRIPAHVFRIGALVLMAVSIIVIPVRRSPGFGITMLDIGQGDCTVIETGKGRTVMIDCGSSDEEEIARYKVIPFLHSRGKDRIDIAVVTHADNDHISGITELLSLPEAESVPIGVLMMPDTALKDEPYMELVRLAASRGVDIKLISSGKSFETDGIRFLCLHPDRGYECTDRNEYSTVLSVSFGNVKALFTGDVEGRGEEIVTKRIIEGYTFLKCAHHGSKNSTPEEFVSKADPLITFISAGRNNQFSHPSPEVVSRLEGAGSRVFVTKEEGALFFESDGKKVRVDTYIKKGANK